MSDLTYRLVVDLSTRGSLDGGLGKIGGGAKTLESSLAKVKDSIGTIGGGLANVFTGAIEKAATLAASLAAVGGAAAVGGVVYGVTHLNNELEKTQVSLAAIFGANDQSTGMADGMKKAGDVMKDMRKDAAALPGEYKDLIAIFKNASIPGFQAGMSINELRGLSSKVMAAGAVTGVPMDQAAREFAQLMEGRAGAHNVLGLRLAGLSGEKAQAFNASSGSERVKMLTTALDKFAPAIETYSTTFDGLSSTLLDNGKKFLGSMTSGVFEKTKGALKDANRWFDAHEVQLNAFASSYGTRLEYAFDVGRRKIGEWTPPFLAFVHNAGDAIGKIWDRIEGPLARLEPKLKKALADPALFEHMEKTAGLYAALKIGGAAAPVVGGLANAGLGAIGGEALFASLGPAAAVVLPALVSIAGAFHSITDETALFHDFAVGAWGRIQQEGGASLHNLALAGERLWPYLVRIGDVMGAQLLMNIEGAITVFGKFTEVIATVAGVVVRTIDTIGEKIDNARGFIDHLTGRQKMGDDAPIQIDRTPQDDAFLHPIKDLSGFLKNEAKKDPQKVKGGGGTNIQKVEIVVSSNQDPSRIARAAVDELKRISMYPTSTRNGPPKFTGAR